ncbi:ABC transporter permease [Lachnoclostridium phytofermentans]|uniref:Inner-membrane translocator n=1 Tax=Lachnoclostridium phytofermentans (strain ATCC 700394 / DSM 18823 / ISDg) TaxID=357809 RepID=A9KIG8_LACP7|nr:ABC transporter permease [Lachnoclostridium phytofermentans]ABX42420.1 inner-membrane translocator [Lachnoclostridium phytofermentans ISDg]
MKNNFLSYSKKQLGNGLKNIYSNKVVLMFLILCIFGIATTGKPLIFTVSEVFTRFGRNTFLVIALIIPVLAGLGLNFGIVVGAMAAQISIFFVVYWGFTGITGLILCVLLSTPIAILFGFLVGWLYNKTKGAEMISGMVLAYFADGLYQLFFLFILGGIIPIKDTTLMIAGGIGVKNTIDLTGNLKYALDTVSMLLLLRILLVLYFVFSAANVILRKKKEGKSGYKLSIIKISVTILLLLLTLIPAIRDFLGTDRLLLLNAITIGCVLAILYVITKICSIKLIQKHKELEVNKYLAMIIIAIIVYALTYIPVVFDITMSISLPVCTYAAIILICGFNRWLLSTKLGQNMRTVGQSRTVANSAGINVNKTRIIAMCISTVLASWGQLIYLQNLGTFSTYGAHSMVGLYAIAALLVGGAGVQMANNKQAILGVILFHTLFVVAPLSASNLLGSSLIGEYFRVFICYGVIALSLALHAWKTIKKPAKQKELK